MTIKRRNLALSIVLGLLIALTCLAAIVLGALVAVMASR